MPHGTAPGCTAPRSQGGLLNPTLKAALFYARKWRVFPVGRDKRPLTEHGFQDATQNEDQIREWWERWPEANVALDIPADVVVIDIDPRNGGRLDAFDFPPTKVAKTPGGGWHLYYSVPSDVRLRGKLATGIDVKRGGRGYVLLPPSVNIEGVAYEWTGTSGIAPLSDEILQQIRRDAPAERAAGDFQFEGGSPYGMAALERECGRMVTAREGERNEQLNKSAFALGQLVAGGELIEDVALRELTLAAERAGLDADEIDHTIRSGFEAGLAEPRSATAEASAFQFEDDKDEEFWLDWQAEDDPVEWLFHPYLPAHAFVLIFGPTQASKSMVARWICAKLSNENRRVSYYSLENPSSVDRRDLKRMRPLPSTNLEHFRITNRMLNLANSDELEALIAREQGRDLLVFDTYVHAFAPPGSTGDENANAVAFARVVRRIIKRTGAAVLVIDHTGFERRDEPRGASAKRQQVDVAIAMEEMEPWLGPGFDARFQMRNVKAARFSNPFVVTGAIRDTSDGGLTVVLNDDNAYRALDRGQLPDGVSVVERMVAARELRRHE